MRRIGTLERIRSVQRLRDDAEARQRAAENQGNKTAARVWAAAAFRYDQTLNALQQAASPSPMEA